MSATPQILSLTGVRFFAAFFVLLFHSEYVWLNDLTLIDGPIRNVMRSGLSSVGFFFILSGFVLGYRYQGVSKQFTYRKYYVARLARIYPVLLFSLLLAAPAALDEVLFVVYALGSVWLSVLTFKLIETPARHRINAWARGRTSAGSVA